MRGFTLSTGLAALTILSVASACKKRDEAPRADTTAIAPPAPAPVAVQNVDLGKAVGPDKRVTNPTTTFGVRDTIYVSVSTTGTASNANLAARWSTEAGQLVDSTAVPIAPTGPAVTEFHITRTSAWPVGKYKVAILLDGRQVSEKDFEIKR